MWWDSPECLDHKADQDLTDLKENRAAQEDQDSLVPLGEKETRVTEGIVDCLDLHLTFHRVMSLLDGKASPAEQGLLGFLGRQGTKVSRG